LKRYTSSYGLVTNHYALAEDPTGEYVLFSEANKIEQERDALLEVQNDHRRLVRELDIALSGIHLAAAQASLCDLIVPVHKLRCQRDNLENERDALKARVESFQQRLGVAFSEANKYVDECKAIKARIAELEAALRGLLDVRRPILPDGGVGNFIDPMNAAWDNAIKVMEGRRTP
ncbi:MAG: hypothetical protein ACYDBH_24695, partial [Acidobacteriaceae bacterium]